MDRTEKETDLAKTKEILYKALIEITDKDLITLEQIESLTVAIEQEFSDIDYTIENTVFNDECKHTKEPIMECECQECRAEQFEVYQEQLRDGRSGI